MNRLTSAIALAIAGAIACSDGVGPTGVGPTTAVTLDVCASLTSVWFAYQNTGGPWTQITPNSAGQLAFDATEKVSVAVAASFFGASITQIINASATEIQGIAVTACNDVGTGTMSGSIAGVSDPQVVRISAAFSKTGANALAPNWTLNDLPVRPADIVATRYQSSFTQPSDRILIRRGVVPPNGTIAALDFTGTESATPQSATASFTGIGANTSVSVTSDVVTQTGTTHELGSLTSATGGTAFTYLSVPTSLRVATDIHFLGARASNAEGVRRIVQYYRTPVDKNLAFGPMVGAPTITTAATSPYIRLRTRVGSQAEYLTAMSVGFTQSDVSTLRSVTVLTTASFVGGTPQTWDVTIPDLSAAGYSTAMGLQNAPYDWSVTAHGGDLVAIIGDAPGDGATLVSSTRFDPNASARQSLTSASGYGRANVHELQFAYPPVRATGLQPSVTSSRPRSRRNTP